jgi:hypothetical protein
MLILATGIQTSLRSPTHTFLRGKKRKTAGMLNCEKKKNRRHGEFIRSFFFTDNDDMVMAMIYDGDPNSKKTFQIQILWRNDSLRNRSTCWNRFAGCLDTNSDKERNRVKPLYGRFKPQQKKHEVLLFKKSYGADSCVTQPNGAIALAHNLCGEDILFQDVDGI